MQIQPYLIVPKLIPQPTWGGGYIAEYKGLDSSQFGRLLVGQSYELSSDSKLSTVLQSKDLPIEIGDSKDGSTLEVIGDPHSVFSLQRLIDQDPQAVLGKKVTEKHGSTMQVLIKFTQAKGNSFQVHVKPLQSFGHWKPKPESWYYFEPGKATLGLKADTDLEAYKQACLVIEKAALDLEASVKRGEKKVEDAKKELQKIVEEQNPFEYVNLVDIPKDAIIDLSSGGIHHSWEEGEEIPLGNIVYEVQLNIMDHECTLRSFDKGKIGNDGSIRPVHVEDYFKALDTDRQQNDPKNLIRSAVWQSEQGVHSALLFDTLNYRSEVLEIAGEYRGEKTSPVKDDSFHHLFVKEGDIHLSVKHPQGGRGDSQLSVQKGASVFIPASIDNYVLSSESKSVIIKTIV